MPKQNTPDLWRTHIPRKTGQNHKYNYGHALIYGAPELTGATRLAASACARIGTGLVTVLANDKTADIYRASLPACILVRNDLSFMDKKVTARIYGSGGLPCKVDFNSNIPTVLDADAIQNLPDKLSPNYVLTPHEGEFAKAFPELNGSKTELAEQAAQKLNAHIVLKGAETVIAAPDGRITINTHSSPYLATAGTGDVLAGIIGGLLAQGMTPFDSACAAVWIHGECGQLIEQGLIADDLINTIPNALKAL